MNHTTVLKGPLQIVLNITNACNLRCLHCFNKSGENFGENELTEGEILKIIGELSDIKPFNLCFSGGEPLIRKELLLKGAKVLSSKGVRISLVTNGCLLDKKTARDLKEAGICEVKVSIDGSTAETHDRLRGVKGSFSKAVKALKNLHEVYCSSYEGSFVVTKFNIDELEETVSLLEKIHVPTLFVRPMIAIGTARKYVDELVPDSNQYREVWRKITKIKSSGKNNIEVEFYDPLNHFFIFPKKNFILGLEIKADGSLILSPHFQIKVGNIRNHGLNEYWESGLPFAWKLPRIKYLLNKIKTQADLTMIHKNMNSYHFDLIDDRENGTGL